MRVLLLLLLFSFNVVSAQESNIPPEYYNNNELSKILYYSRQLLTRAPVREFIWETFGDEIVKIYPEAAKTKEISESQFILLLREIPELQPLIEKYLKAVPEIDPDDKKQDALREKFKDKFRLIIAKDNVIAQFKKLYDPYSAFEVAPEGEIAYRSSETEIYFNHPQIQGRKIIPPTDLKQVLIDFIDGAKPNTSFYFNVFDFDLEDVADALIRAHKRGVKILGGIDGRMAGQIKNDKGEVITDRLRPQVELIYKKLKKAGVYVHPTTMSALNHQKIAIRNLGSEGEGEILFSSGNFTQSCIGQEGDLKDIENRPKDSIPNANHMVIFKSPILSIITAHELIKRLHPNYQLTGKDLPLGGAYQIYGEMDPKLKLYNTILFAFSPRGGNGDINLNILSRIINNTSGILKFGQFVMTSKTLLTAIVNRIKSDLEKIGHYSFLSIGDGPFALRDYSVFVALSGLKKEDGIYLEDPDAEIRKVLNQSELEKLREHIRVAPQEYGFSEKIFKIKNPDGTITERKYGAKYHMKAMISGLFAVLGTSFNFSDNAEKNNEQLLVVRDMKLWKALNGALDWAYKSAKGPVYDLAMRRNHFAQEESVSEKNIKDKKAGKSSAYEKLNCSKALKAG